MPVVTRRQARLLANQPLLETAADKSELMARYLGGKRLEDLPTEIIDLIGQAAREQSVPAYSDYSVASDSPYTVLAGPLPCHCQDNDREAGMEDSYLPCSRQKHSFVLNLEEVAEYCV